MNILEKIYKSFKGKAEVQKPILITGENMTYTKLDTALSDKEVYQKLLIDKNREAGGTLTPTMIMREVDEIYSHYLEKFKNK